jgi:hypothetical protein
MFTDAATSSSAERLPVRGRDGPPLARHHEHDPGTTRSPCRDNALSRHDVLILSADTLAAALLGAAVELAGHQPHFPQADEVARAALRRVRPRLVIVDCNDDHACSEAFVGPVIMTGAQLLLFDSPRHAAVGVDVARRLGLDVVHLPDDHALLLQRLRELLPVSPS